MDNCLFCRIVREEIPAEVVLENDQVVAFRDIKPQAPQHFLLIPKIHCSQLGDFDSDRYGAAMLKAAQQLAKQQGLESGGWRLVVNNGRDAGQEVHHLHWHILAGRRLNWPPG